jgi:hypothetical protein
MTYLSKRQKLHKKNKKTKKIIPNYDNHYRKKRWSKKKYKVNNFNMRGGAAQNIYVFIRPFYMESDEEKVKTAASIFYYGDFNLKSGCTSSRGAIDYIKDKNLNEESALKDSTFQMLISTIGVKQYEKFISLFPSSNSRPKLNNTRKTNEVYLEEVKTDSQPIVTMRNSFATKYSDPINKSKNGIITPIDCFKALRSLVKTNKGLQSIYDYLAGNCYVEFGLILPHPKNNFFGRYAYNFDLQDDNLDADIKDLTKINEKDLTHERYPQYLKDEAKNHKTTEDAVANKLITDNTMNDEIETLVQYPDFFITRNRIYELIRYRDSEHGSISKNHRLLITRSTNWKRFNVLTMGLGGDIKSFEDDIDFLKRMKIAAEYYIEQTRKKLGWPDESKYIGLFFHCFPQNTIDVLHLHIVDISNPPVKHSNKNLHIDNVILELESELKTMRNNLFLQLQAASKDIDELQQIETLIKDAGATSIKTVPRQDRCSILIYKIENDWYFEIIPIKASTDAQPAYLLNPELNSLFDDIVSIVISKESKGRLKHLNKSEEYGMDSVITTFGGDLWFVCYKLSDKLGYTVYENDNNIDQNHYLKYITLALEELMIAPTTPTTPTTSIIETPIIKTPIIESKSSGWRLGSLFGYSKPNNTPEKDNDNSINLYLCNDSLDNDIDDILAILFIQCMIKKYNKKITLHYKEDDTLKWSGLSDTNPEVNKVKTTILDKIYGLKDLTHIFTNKLEPSPRLPNSSTSS